MASTDRTPNHALRSCLNALGWSPEQLAHRVTAFARTVGVQVTVSDKAPYYWLSGGRPRPRTATLVAAVLAEGTGEPITPSDLGWAHAPAPVRTAADADPAETWGEPHQALHALEQVLAADHSVGDDSAYAVLNRADFVSAARSWLQDADRITGTVRRRGEPPPEVAEFDRLVDARRRLDDVVGGGALFRSVQADLHLVVGLLKRRSHDDAVERHLYAVVAELARLGAWTSFDSGHHGRAQRYFLVALQAAAHSGDPTLATHILGFMAHQLIALGKCQDAIDILEATHEGAHTAISPVEEAALLARLASAYGRTRQARRAETAAAMAFERLADRGSTADSTRMYWCDTSDLDVVIGEAYLHLGATDKVIFHIERALEGLGRGRIRDRSQGMLSLAAAYLMVGEQGNALHIAEQAVDLAAQHDSHRTSTAVAAFRHQLADIPDRHLLAQFDEHLKTRGRLGTWTG